MAIKKKTILTDDTTLPTLNPLPPPAYTNIISIPFALGIGLSPQPNRRTIPITPDSIFPLRPSQNVGFDKSITLLTQPNPMYLNDINGIFYLYSGALSDICGGIVPKFETGYIAGQAAAGILTASQGYRQGAILFNAATSAWVQSLTDYNKASPTDSPTTWQQITLPYLPVLGNTTAGQAINVPATTINFVGATVQANATNANNAIVTIQTATAPLQLYQQGRLTLVDSKPYDDTDSNGSSTLYFTPTEQGNLISLWNGSAWVTQTFNQLSLNLAGIDDSVDIATNNYDVYVGKNSSGVLILTYDTFNGNRTKLPSPNNNGRWVNNAASIGIPQYQGLLLGSVSINVRRSYSYSGIRGLWNLYNQVSKPLQATQGSIVYTASPVIWFLWGFNISNTGGVGNWRNQWYDNGNSTTDGLGRFSFLLDPLYNKSLFLSYKGTGTSGLGGDNIFVGIVANASPGSGSSGITPLAFSIQNDDASGTAGTLNNINVLTYSYNYNSSSPGYNTNGYQYIQKIELTTGTGTAASGNAYGSDTGGGLTAEFWC